jgi:hypothetical protein
VEEGTRAFLQTNEIVSDAERNPLQCVAFLPHATFTLGGALFRALRCGLWGRRFQMTTNVVKDGATKAPLVLGAGILSVTAVGLFAGLFGQSLGWVAEIVIATVGMLLAWRFA